MDDLERQRYRAERMAYYSALSDAELETIWSAREDDECSLGGIELDVIRQLLRMRKGIKPKYGHHARVCPRCCRVGDNCICERTWF